MGVDGGIHMTEVAHSRCIRVWDGLFVRESRFLRKAKVALGLVEGLGFQGLVGLYERTSVRLNQAGAADLSEGAASSEGEEATQRKSHHGVPGLGFRGF